MKIYQKKLFKHTLMQQLNLRIHSRCNADEAEDADVVGDANDEYDPSLNVEREHVSQFHHFPLV